MTGSPYLDKPIFGHDMWCAEFVTSRHTECIRFLKHQQGLRHAAFGTSGPLSHHNFYDPHITTLRYILDRRAVVTETTV